MPRLGLQQAAVELRQLAIEERREGREALDSGFTSLMFDGSRKPLQQNIDETAAIAEMAHAAGISCEGEIGFVGYSGGEGSAGTDPDEAATFATQTGVDAMAISVGNVHLQQNKEGGLDEDRIRRIQAVNNVPLVIHGGSGVPVEQRARLARETAICKFNIGTELRMAFGTALRAAVNRDPDRFDRVTILKETHDPVVAAARTVIRAFRDKLPDIFPGRTEVPKTLIFAKTDSHADDIIQIVRAEFGESNDFCRKITHQADNPKSVISDFRNAYSPRIAVTVT